jgi:hypothetical protein
MPLMAPTGAVATQFGVILVNRTEVLAIIGEVVGHFGVP